MVEIRERAQAFNLQAAAYEWKGILASGGEGPASSGAAVFAPLDMTRTLKDNGVLHLGLSCEGLSLSSNVGVPAVYLHWLDPLVQ